MGEEADKAAGRHVPLLVKIAPDLSDEDIDDVARLALDLKLDGIIATNTTIGRAGLAASPDKVEECGAGGLSGAPLKQRSLEVLRRLKDATGGALTLVAVGGVETAQDVQERLDAGATLVQGYTAFLYEGPFWAARINRQLARHRPALTATLQTGPDRSYRPGSPRQVTAGGCLVDEIVRNCQEGNSPRLTCGLGSRSLAELQGAHGAVPDGAALHFAELLRQPLRSLRDRMNTSTKTARNMTQNPPRT